VRLGAAVGTDAPCLVLAAYRRGARRPAPRVAAAAGRRGPGGVATVIDGELLESGSSGWLRVTAG